MSRWSFILGTVYMLQRPPPPYNQLELGIIVCWAACGSWESGTVIVSCDWVRNIKLRLLFGFVISLIRYNNHSVDYVVIWSQNSEICFNRTPACPVTSYIGEGENPVRLWKINVAVEFMGTPGCYVHKHNRDSAEWVSSEDIRNIILTCYAQIRSIDLN